MRILAKEGSRRREQDEDEDEDEVKKEAEGIGHRGNVAYWKAASAEGPGPAWSCWSPPLTSPPAD